MLVQTSSGRSLWHINMYDEMSLVYFIPFTLPRNTHHFPFKDLVKNEAFIWGNLEWQALN